MGIKTTIENTDAQSVEQQPSQTAIGVALARAMAAIEKREEIRGHDYLAEIFLPENMKASLKGTTMTNEVILSRTPGMYEYIIARTAYFDVIVEQALRENISQIVFLGAGFDTRAYRFNDLIDKTKIFELDIHSTQEHKIKLLHQNNVTIPKQLTFVPINFNTETLDDVLFKFGYKKDQTNLFVWEGVIYYLSPEAVDNTLSFIKKSSSTGSTVCFDYSVFWREMLDAYGVKELIETMKRDHSGEPNRFGIERGKMELFLTERGYSIIDHVKAEEMERKFLTLQNGSLAGNVVGIFCFAHASILN